MSGSDTTEYIGKVELDLSKYGGEDLYCDGEVEDELLEIAESHAQQEFPSIIAQRLKWPILYHLSDLRENIVSWIDLKPGAKILEVGAGCGAISGALLKKAGRLDCVELSKKRSLINANRHKDAQNMCIHVGNFEDIEPGLDTDYDAVFLIGVFEYAASYIHDEDPYGSFLKIIRKHVAKDGIIVIAIENRLGMKYFGGAREDHLGEFFKGLEDYPDGGVVRTFSRPALEKLLKAVGVGEYHFYYPYPDYKFMLSLYSDERLPLQGELNTNKLKLDRDRMELFDEGKAYDSVIRDGLFPVFSNSYLLVLGKRPDVVYSKYSNDRDKLYAIRTDIIKNNKGVFVEKYPMTEEAAEHVKKIPGLKEKLEITFKGSGLKLCDVTLTEDGSGVRFEYVKGSTMEELLDAAIRKNDREEIKALLSEYARIQKYNGNGVIADPDIQLANLIKSDDGWTLIDYEWAGEERGGYPDNAIRGIYLFKEYNSLGAKLDMELAREAIPELPEVFDMQALWNKEREFQKSVTGSRLALGELNELMGNGVINAADEELPAHEEEPEPEVQVKGGFKRRLQASWHEKALEDYNKELEKQKDPYSYKPGAMTEVKERKLGRRCVLVPYSAACCDVAKGESEFVIFAADGGKLELDAAGTIESRFDSDKESLWLYADEDVLCADGYCRYPYYKPDWSVDTLFSYLYTGSIFAVRRSALGSACAALPPQFAEEKGLKFIYALCLQLADLGVPMHVNNRPVFHTVAAEVKNYGNMLIADPLCCGPEYNDVREAYLSRHGIKAEFKADRDGCTYPLFEKKGKGVSVIIPTKDHPALLDECVRSIRENSTYRDVQIIVTDNGSAGLNKEKYERLAREYDLRYVYRKAEFNFAQMCNDAAKLADGDLLIFLNDDTKVITSDWIERMWGQAMLPGIGAVGCKLLYPGAGDKIQHCGVSNTCGGPVHRLKGLTDSVSFDRGRNRGVRNVIAVTAACLAISRKVFNETEGFFEGLPVAYNDVDLCLCLHESGRRNVMRNDVKMLHFESASRGDDRIDEKKKQRLRAELNKLYERHPDLIAVDPFEHLRLSDESGIYEEAHPYEIKKLEPVKELQAVKDKKGFSPVNEALIIKVDEMGADPTGRSILIDMHVHVQDWDNADYNYYAYLEGNGKRYLLPVQRRYRADVEEIYVKQKHIGLSGLALKIDRAALKSGEYSLWVEAKSRISRQRLFRKADTILKVDQI